MKKLYIQAFAATTILLGCSCNNNDPVEKNQPASNEPKQLSYTVTAVYPHEPTSFTEGLEFRDGFLYEGTGDTEYKGISKLAKIDLKTGKDVQKINLSKDFFGEGISVLNGKIYQMTYKEQKCFMYDAKTFAKLKEFTYEGEGWGMTNDGKQLIMSNGSNNLYFRDPETFAVTKTVAVSNNYGPLANINELEYVDGFVYANVWTTNKIVKIDLSKGLVVAEVNLEDLLSKYAPETAGTKIDVLNGIAYDNIGKRFFITGKYYPKIFEVKFN
jgi:glutamine cyclotransferase